MYKVETRVVRIKGLEGEIKAEIEELHKCFFSNRKLVIGLLRLKGNYLSGGLNLTARFLGLITFDIFLAESSEYFLKWDNGILRVYRGSVELAPGSSVEIEQKYLGIGS